VTIGYGSSPEIDIPLSLPQLQSDHIKIVEQSGVFYIFNKANDPYVTLNGRPFSKRKLRLHDTIYVYDVEIIIDMLPQEPINKDFDFNLENLLKDKIEAKQVHTPQPFEDEDSPLSLTEIDALVQEAEEIEDLAGEQAAETSMLREDELIIELQKRQENLASTEKKVPVAQITVPLKTQKNETEENLTSVITIPKQMIATKYTAMPLDPQSTFSHILEFVKAKIWWIIMVITILFIMGAIIFFSYKNSLKQEREAARDVADVAMALLYAKQNPTHIKQHNWSEVSFLRDKISRLVHQSNEPLNVDTQGQFKNVPFILRIYTSKDRSRFLVVAQPTSAWFHWFIPIRAIVIDSNDMRLRVTTEIKALNVHLLRTASLENTDEIESILERSPIIPLISIEKGLRKGEFAPPEDVAFADPEGMDYVYNAPRYFKMTESIVAHAAKMTERKHSSDDVAALMNQLVQISTLPHLIFYTSEGIEVATKAYSKLSSYHFGDQLHIGLVTYNSDKNYIVKTSLMNTSDKAHEMAFAGASALETEVGEQEKTLSTWAMQMADMLNDRRAALIPITNAIHELLAQNNQKPKEEFLQRYYRLIALYDQTDVDQQNKIILGLQGLLKDYLVKQPGGNLNSFIVEMSEVGLESYAYSLAGRKGVGMQGPLYDKVVKATNLNDLYHQAAISAEYLEMSLYNPMQKQEIYNLLRLLVLKRSGVLVDKSDMVVSPPMLPFEAR
jgi:hypothetical protein